MARDFNGTFYSNPDKRQRLHAANDRLGQVSKTLIGNILHNVKFYDVIDHTHAENLIPSPFKTYVNQSRTPGAVYRNRTAFDLESHLHFVGSTLADLLVTPDAEIEHLEVVFGNDAALDRFLSTLRITHEDDTDNVLRDFGKDVPKYTKTRRTGALRPVKAVSSTETSIRIHDTAQNIVFDVKADTGVMNGTYPDTRDFLHESLIYNRAFGIVAGTDPRIEDAIEARQLILSDLANVRPIEILHRIPHYLETGGYALDYESYAKLIAVLRGMARNPEVLDGYVYVNGPARQHQEASEKALKQFTQSVADIHNLRTAHNET